MAGGIKGKFGLRKQTYILLALLALISTQAFASDIDRRSGLGYAQSIGGPAGLALNYGLGNLGLEAIVGMSRFSYADEVIEPRNIFAAGLGAHFHLLSSQKGALTIGSRFNLATGAAVSGNTSTNPSAQAPEVTQVGFDVPLRVYWFPTRHISIHSEFGLSFYMGAEDGLLINAEDSGTALLPGGLAIVAFRQGSAVGQLGLTYWW